jgi:hypothetical protein
MDIYIVLKHYLNGYKHTQLATANKDDAFEFFDKQKEDSSYFWIIEKWTGTECTTIIKK